MSCSKLSLSLRAEAGHTNHRGAEQAPAAAKEQVEAGARGGAAGGPKGGFTDTSGPVRPARSHRKGEKRVVTMESQGLERRHLSVRPQSASSSTASAAGVTFTLVPDRVQGLSPAPLPPRRPRAAPEASNARRRERTAAHFQGDQQTAHRPWQGEENGLRLTH